MNVKRVQHIRFLVVFLFVFVMSLNGFGQTEPETELNDTTQNQMGSEDGKHYAPAYYFYMHSLFPSTITPTLVDTSIHHPYNEDISLYSRNLYAHLGVFAQANYSMNFSFYRKHGFAYKTLPYNSYIRTIENWRFYQLDEIYTHLEYNFVNGKENHFSVEHAQQITEDLHFALGLETIIGEGRYVRQSTRAVNLGATLRYKLPSGRYGFSAYYLLNLINPQENGGLADDAEFEDSLYAPSSINVRFSGLQASNRLFQNTVFFRHYLALSGKSKDSSEVIENKLGYLVHDIEFSSDKHLFSAQLDTTLFDNFYLNSKETVDQMKHLQFRTGLFWSSYLPEDTLPDKKNFIRFSAGIMYDFHQLKGIYRFRTHQLTPAGVLQVKLFNRLHINANALITLMGYNAGDLTVEGRLGMDFLRNEKAKHQLVANIGLYNYAPDFFFTYTLANNYKWDYYTQGFGWNKQQTITAGFSWIYQNYTVGVNYYTLNNCMMLDKSGQPMQIDKFVNVYQLSAYIPFHIKGFGFNTNLYLQYSDNDYIRIPVFAARQSVYYGFPMFKKALYLQLGFDFLYNTAYYANAYNPVLQQFYLQDDKEIGNYGYLDFYLRGKIRRFQVQFKLTHLWAGLLGKTYYLVPHYPAKNLGFAVGVAWRFHD